MYSTAACQRLKQLICSALLLTLFLGADRSLSQGDSIATIRTAVQDLILDEKYAEAERRAKRWLELAERSGDQSLGISDALESLTRIYAGLRRYDDAEAVWRRCLELRVNALGPKHALVSKTIDVMMGIYIDQGRTAEAQALWRDGLAAFQKRPPVAAIERLPNPLDLTVKQVSNLIAQGRLKEAEDVLRRNSDDVSLATFLLDRGRYAEAIILHRRLFDSAPTGERGISMATLYRQRGLATYEQEFLQKAITAQERTIGPEHPDLIGSLTTLASSFEKQNENAKAYTALKRVTGIVSRIRSRQAFTAEASAAVQLRQPYLDFLRIASRLSRERPEQIDILTSETFEIGQLATETVLSITLSQMGVRLSQGTGALARLVRKRQDSEREWQRLDKLLLAAVTIGGQTQKEGLRSQIATVEKELTASDDQLRTSFSQYFDLAIPAPLKLSDVQALLQSNEAVIQFAAIGDQAYVWVVTKSTAKWVTVTQTPAEIQTTVAALRCGLDYPGAWKSSRCAQLFGRIYTKADQAVPRPLPYDLNRAYQLYQTLFGRLEDLIVGKHLLVVPSGTLSSVPLHALVTQKPMVGIPNNWAGYSRASWMAKAHAITVLPSVASLKTFRTDTSRIAAPNPYIAFANPVLTGAPGAENAALQRRVCLDNEPVLQTVAMDSSVDGTTARYFRGQLADVASVRNMAQIVETADEVCAVARKLGVSPRDVFLADKATERTVKSLSRSGTLENYRIIHFATHGLLASETEIIAEGLSEPALVLTPPPIASAEDDGLLTASEIAQLKLNADWVIMSACNTAAGDKGNAEALSGLARAFFYSGARALLVSHWYVNSTATVTLITRVFAELQRVPTIGRAEALRRAMVEFINNETEPGAHPAYWAPFVVVGEGALQ
jgi:CHAT domain-containing protein